jgi:hypothetical protein
MSMICIKQRVSDLIFEVDGCVKVGDFWIDGFANDIALGGVEKGAHFYPQNQYGLPSIVT